ncbi:phenoloxidase-activating factor 1-like [Neocloeon triangulifer]|uniref:phenoloxidase-activating factor 1-like n=1 Tax=Neocloeon triangulifer TaxID=2078957 RepID=UPI00286F8E71|nr:phenoloxidase-activating factor 1-like [Neocloeon triangulifer]
MTRMAPNILLSIFIVSALLSGSKGAILDFDMLLDNPESAYEYETIGAANQSRDAKRSPYGGYGHGGYGYGHHYRPYYPRHTTTTTEEPVPLECGAGPFDGGPPLVCMLRTECIAQGGRLGEPCGRGFSRGFCCQWPNLLKCGDTTSAINAIMRNPDYPDTTSNPLSCVIGIVPRPEACGIRIEFMDALMGQTRDGVCYQDQFTVIGGGFTDSDGFNTHICGLAKGYATMIPVNQTSDLVQLVLLSQSRNVMFNINITQVHCGALYLPFNDLCGVRNNPVANNARKLDLGPSNVSAPVEVARPQAKISDSGNFSLSNAEGKILGGTPVAGIQYPWMVAILYDGSHICSGTLIARQWVMTAAHCVTFYAADGLPSVRRLRLWLGSYDLSLSIKQEIRRVIRKVDRIYVHNEFEGNNYDVAIMKMNETVIFNAAIRPVCFPEDIDQNYGGWQGIIAGWGTNGGPTKSNVLLGGTVPILRNPACSTAWSALNVEIRNSMICAGDGSVAQCTGDSGGPLISADEDGLYSFIGISSFSAPPACGNPDFPDVYMRTSSFLSWIALVLALPPPPDHIPSPFGPYGESLFDKKS